MTEHGQCLVDITLDGDVFMLMPRYDGECSSYGDQACILYGKVTKD